RRDVMALIAGAAWPMLVRAQQRRGVPKVGVLWHAAGADGEWPYYGCLLEGLEELGYSQGKIELIHRFPDEKPEKFQSMAAELVALAPDVLVGIGGAAPYVKKATSTIPMVFMYVADPIGAKLVESIRRPGGNATGLTNFGLELVVSAALPISVPPDERASYHSRPIPTISPLPVLPPVPYGTFADLVQSYRTNPKSPIHSLKHGVRNGYNRIFD